MYKGPSQTIYAMVAIGGEMKRWKMRLDPTHFDQLHGVIAERMELIDENVAADLDSNSRCLECDEPIRPDQAAIVWAKVYPRGHESEEFWGRVHKEEWSDAASRIVVGSPQQG